MSSIDGNRHAFESSSVTITAQWTVNDPVIYVNHTPENHYVDLAISDPASNDMLAHFQIGSPLEAIKAGHNLVNASLNLARTLDIDISELRAVTPPEWWLGHQ